MIATPALNVGFFARSVTYLCEHGEAGAMGIVINQPLDLSVVDILEHLEIIASGSLLEEPILAGGPVDVDHGFVLHSAEGEWDASLEVTAGICMTTSQDILAAIAHGAGPKKRLIALGYAGWGPGQLEAELASNSWITAPAWEDILFSVPAGERLNAASQTLGFDINLMTSESGHA
nr:YqgE/AlgH family protein [Luminiphilus syltensis]